MLALNVGCGTRVHPAWTNVDMTVTAPGVIAADLTRGIPFPDNRFDVVYHSHVLEHFRREDAARFMAECRRVLRPGGVVRVVVPDLEQIARLYLQKLDAAASAPDSQAAAVEYDWILLEMFDQTVREEPGGGMWRFLMQEPLPARDFVAGRIGNHALPNAAASNAPAVRGGLASRLLGRLLQWRRYPHFAREALARVVLGGDHASLRVGRFRRSGEVHQWMYDRYSLTRLLASCGYEQARQVGPTESAIPDWRSNNLDTEPDGTVYKPDSLFVEARKPSA
jgi:SAM-dependent methyltransferase